MDISSIGEKVSAYVGARVDAFTGTVNDGMDRLKQDAIGGFFNIVESGLGLLQTTEYGKAAAQRRANARHKLNSHL